MHETLSAFCARDGSAYLLEQWDAAANFPLTPDTIRYGSKQRVWWRCERGHRWQAIVYTRTSSHTGCPYCTGRLPIPGETDLASSAPAVAAEWHPDRNGFLTPQMVTDGSNRKVWWQCSKGHAYATVVEARTGKQKCGCPVCAGRISPEKQTRYRALLGQQKRGE